MSTMTSSAQTVQRIESRSWIQRHLLTTYFLIAFAGTWLVTLPALLARGFGLFSMEDSVVMLLAALGPFTGPLASALLVTGAQSGKEGIKIFLRRFVQLRVGSGWYLLVVAGYPILYLIGLLPVLGIDAYSGAENRLAAAIPAYLAALLVQLILPSLGEEPGWRGFALPHLQQQYGPLTGTLILGSLHALWHLPIYIIFGPIDPLTVVGNSGAIIAASFLWTWLYNHGRGSIFFAMLVHAASNASSALVLGLLGNIRVDAVFSVVLFSAVALLVIVFTRGRLSYADLPKQLSTSIR